MPYTDEDLLNPEKQDELDLAALVAAEPESVAAPVGPQDGLARLAELIAARQAQPEGPGSAEREYLAQNKPQAGWKNVLGAVGSAIAESTGTSGAIDRFHKTQQMAEQRRREGLEAARSIDLGRRPVDRSTAELGVMAGMTPEASAAMTQDSPGLKLLNSGMGQLGARYKSLDMQAAKAEEDRAAREQMQRDRLEQQARLQAERLAAQEKLQGQRLTAKKGSGGGGGGGGLTPDMLAKGRITHLRMSTGIDPAVVDAYAAGTTEGIAPEQLAKLQNQDQVWALQPAKKKAELLKAQGLKEAGNQDDIDKTIALKKRDPEKRLKYKQEIDQSHRAISEARAAWNTLSDDDKKVIAQFSGSTWESGAIRDAKLSPEGRAKVGAILALSNRIIKETSGAAVSDSEWDRIAGEMGLAGKSFDLFNTPAGIQRWLDSALSGWVRNKRTIESEFNDLFPKKGAPGG